MTERHPLDSIVEALEAALTYIDMSPCDPDITSAQTAAHKRLVDADARAALQLARQMREGEPVAWGVLCTIRPEGHGPYDAFDQVELDRDAAEYLTTIYTAGANPRVVPLYALPLAPEGAEEPADG